MAAYSEFFILKFELDHRLFEHLYSVIRITWEMVYHDRGDWLNKLIESIEDSDWCSRVFICRKNEYDIYQV